MVWVVVPLDEIKIDKAFVRAVVAMVCPLRCEVVAEGYYLSRPLPAAALEQWARTAPWGCADKMRQLSLRHGRSFAALRMTCEAVALALIGPGSIPGEKRRQALALMFSRDTRETVRQLMSC